MHLSEKRCRQIKPKTKYCTHCQANMMDMPHQSGDGFAATLQVGIKNLIKMQPTFK
jgi:hypothetical protein